VIYLISSTKGEKLKSARWTKDKRLEFIDFRLQWDGQLNRSDLTDFFGISVPQASIDISEYSKLSAANLNYDKSLKTYLKGEDFVPLFDTSSPESYLSELIAQSSTGTAPDSSYLGWTPANDFVPILTRKVPSKILLRVLSAIRRSCVIDVSYLSKNQEHPTDRLLSPHAIVNDGIRWHIRAYCYKRAEFRDFVVARFMDVKLLDDQGQESLEDAEWNNIIKLELHPDPSLPASHQKVIELEYSMENGLAEVSCREALVFYIQRRLGIEFTDKTVIEGQNIMKGHFG